jgi:hypothetical protein
MDISIAVASVTGRCLPVMLTSCREYAPKVPVYLRTPIDKPRQDVYVQLRGSARSFGEDYNEVIDAAFADGCDAVIAANDDVVLTPTSVSVLLEDLNVIADEYGDYVGWVCARCDAARPLQNVRSNPYNEKVEFFKFPWEEYILPMKAVSPIFGVITRSAWQAAKFPPLNWYSDDVHCMDLEKAGYHHFLSRSYVHHVGSASTGMDAQALTDASMPWIMSHRPEYADMWFGGKK